VYQCRENISYTATIFDKYVPYTCLNNRTRLELFSRGKLNLDQEENPMIKRTTLKPIASVLGTTFVVSLATSPIATATENPFNLNELTKGYMVAGHDAEGKCGEGKCGDKKESEGKCGEGKCGDKKESEGKCGDKKESEGKCGEGKCGDKK
jgi:uncharacterized low-complexity protein